MSNLGPGDKPAVVRRRAAKSKPKRKRQPRQQPSTEARKNAAYGSRPARPNPKPRPSRPAPPPKPAAAPNFPTAVPSRPGATDDTRPGHATHEVHDTKGDADRGRAEAFQRTPQGRKAVRDTYAEQERERRKQILLGTYGDVNPVSREVQRFHDERTRVEAYKAEALKAIKHAGETGEYNPTPSERERIRKGIRVINKQGDTARAHLQEEQYTQPKYGTGEAYDGEKHHNVLEGIGQVMKQIAGAGGGANGGTSKAKGAVASNEEFLGNLQRVERAMGPIDAAYKNTLKPSMDATTRALAETNRLASASAGAALAASEGKNIAHGAVEGFKSNDKSYTELVKKLGIDGPAAVILGTAGDIAFDPSTYLSLGFKAPATAVERVALRNLAKKTAPAIKKAAKAGDQELQDKLAAEFAEKVAAVQRKAAKHEGTTRGVQVGVRLPGGRHIQTKGRATAAVGKQVTRGTRKVQAADNAVSRSINEVLRSLSPHVRAQGVSRAEHAAQKDIERRAAALRNRTAREGRQLGKYIQRVTGGDLGRVRQIVDAIEAGTVRNLPDDLREAAERAQTFHAKVSADFEKLTGKPLRLAETVLPKADVDEALGVARQVLDARVGKATRRAEDVDIEDAVTRKLGGATDVARAGSKIADRNVDLAAAESLAERVGAREHPLSHAEERDLVDRLAGIVENLRQDAHTNIARTRTNDELGAIRRGEADAADVKKALEAEDFYKRRAADQRRGGNRTAARASEAKAREARAVIKAHRATVEPQHLAAVEAEGGNVLKGRAGRLEALLGHLQERVAHEPPVDYIPRQTQKAMEAAAEGQPLRQGVGNGRAGHEAQRLERRRQADVRGEKPDYLSEELPQLEARYGSQMGRRLGSLSLWKQMTERFARPATLDALAEEGGVIYRVDSTGAHRIDPLDRVANEQAAAELELRMAMGDTDDTGYWVLPEEQDKLLQSRVEHGGERTATGNLYDRWLRGFKAMNTILRPGFFATTVAGNTWQMYLADASVADMKDAWRFLARMRSEDLKAVDPKAGVGFRGEAGGRAAILDHVGGHKTFVVDGRTATFGDLFEEAIDAGAVRTGSRLGDPTELTLEQQAQRRLSKGAKAAPHKTTEWLGELAEDLDDMTKLALYVRGRTKMGLDSRAATEFAFSKMIDYSDLSSAERKWFKRLMPFYVYTARNLPIQVKSLLARPGKLANYEKVRQSLAELSGLGEGWEGQRTEAEQERMPVPLPGVTSRGFQVFMDPRLPVSDLAAPAQLLEGPGGAARGGQRYASGIVPLLKAPVELLVNKRLDYDRPINQPGYRPPAGWLLRHIPGATDDKQRVHARSGEKYTGAKPVIDYLLRSLGGAPGSAAASLGSEVPDRSELPPAARVAASNIFGVGASASDPLEAVLAAVQEAANKRYDKRSELKARGLGSGDKEFVANEDEIQALRDLSTKVRGTLGYPEDRRRRDEIERRRLDVREPAGVRAERNRLDALRRQYGG